MNISSTAKTYAKAIFELAQEREITGQIFDEFKAFLQFIKKNPAIHKLLELPNVVQREKRLIDLFYADYSKTFVHFIVFILKNKRYDLLEQIFLDFQQRYDLSKNRIRIETITAVPLTQNKLAEINQQMSRLTNKNVIIENRIDPSIIGGIIIKLNGQLFNASIIGQFKKLKQYLIKNQD